MKRVLTFLAVMAVMGLTAAVQAAPPVFDAPFYPCTDAFSVPLTTHSWTAVPSSNCSGRVLISLVNSSSNTGDFVGITSNSTDTPTTSTSTWSIQFPKGSSDRGYPLDSGTYLWLKTTHTSAESVTGQEFNTR